KALPYADFPWQRRGWRISPVQCISLILTLFQSRTVTKTVTRFLTDRCVQAGEGARLRPAHPAAVNPEEHFECRVAEHARDVLRRVTVFEREARECVTALVDDTRSDFGVTQNPRPVARTEVGEVDRCVAS